MNARIDRKRDRRENIKLLLAEYVNSGVVLSVDRSAVNREIYQIKVDKLLKNEEIRRICKKLNDTGYTTKVMLLRATPVKNVKPAVRMKKCRSVVQTKRMKRRSSVTQAKMVIIAKVDAPNIPNNPKGLPDPDGKKPKKRGK